MMMKNYMNYMYVNVLVFCLRTYRNSYVVVVILFCIVIIFVIIVVVSP